jgi:hypothetical protein
MILITDTAGFENSKSFKNEEFIFDSSHSKDDKLLKFT